MKGGAGCNILAPVNQFAIGRYYGFTGILVSFLARHNPVAIVPVSVMFGGIVAAGGIIQRRMGLPDATVLVLQGLIFVVLLTSETLYGRFAIFRPGDAKERT